METDPVCKMAIEPQEAAARMEYQGATYYFCSQGCQKEFTAHPEKFVAKKPGSGHTQGHG
ncbi:MAG: YHS domain-containing protein [Pseudomonadota bacterium]